MANTRCSLRSKVLFFGWSPNCSASSQLETWAAPLTVSHVFRPEDGSVFCFFKVSPFFSQNQWIGSGEFYRKPWTSLKKLEIWGFCCIFVPLTNPRTRMFAKLLPLAHGSVSCWGWKTTEKKRQIHDAEMHWNSWCRNYTVSTTEADFSEEFQAFSIRKRATLNIVFIQVTSSSRSFYHSKKPVEWSNMGPHLPATPRHLGPHQPLTLVCWRSHLTHSFSLSLYTYI